jgi:TonB family protein
MYYPISTDSLKGNQDYIYDARGTVKEMTLRDDAGRILGREAYTYEYDSFGNWTKMTSSVVIYESGKLIYEPIEATYRTISYYFDDTVAHMVKPSTSPIGATVANNARVSDTYPKIESKTRLSEVPNTQTAAQIADVSSPESTNPPPGSYSSLNTERVIITKDVGKELSSNSAANGNAARQMLQILAEEPPPMASVQKRISGEVLNGRALSLPKPVYPPGAQAAAISGTVIVEVTIDENGRVAAARVVRGHPMLRVSALRAARLAHFEPTMLSGQPVKVTGILAYNFIRR